MHIRIVLELWSSVFILFYIISINYNFESILNYNKIKKINLNHKLNIITTEKIYSKWIIRLKIQFLCTVQTAQIID